jgi:hypothetical protein
MSWKLQPVAPSSCATGLGRDLGLAHRTLGPVRRWAGFCLLAASDVLGTGWFGAVAAEVGPGQTIPREESRSAAALRARQRPEGRGAVSRVRTW